MTIHHATAKKAAKIGIILNEIENAHGIVVEAHWAEHNQRFVGEDAKSALEAMTLLRTLHLEYPGVTMEHVNDEMFVVSSKEYPDVMLLESDTLPDLADILAAADEAGIDPEEGFEEQQSGSIVKDVYKQEYAKRGNRDHCGDWLAKQLEGISTDEFILILQANGVPLDGKWGTLPDRQPRGWQGQFRMCGRRALIPYICGEEVLKFHDGTQVDVDPDWADTQEF